MEAPLLVMILKSWNKIWKMHKLVIADTSCLILLGKINQLSLLQDFFKEVYITEEVNIEYGEPLPNWIKIEKVKSEFIQLSLELQLDKGKRVPSL